MRLSHKPKVFTSKAFARFYKLRTLLQANKPQRVKQLQLIVNTGLLSIPCVRVVEVVSLPAIAPASVIDISEKCRQGNPA